MATNRIDDILAEVHEEVRRRRLAGQYPAGYEAGIEDLHNDELGKKSQSSDLPVHPLEGALQELRVRIEAVSQIERDRTRFVPLRFLRELAMSRHQLIRLAAEVRLIAESIESIVERIVETETVRSNAQLREAQHLLDIVYERTLILERMVVIAQELDDRVAALEKR